MIRGIHTAYATMTFTYLKKYMLHCLPIAALLSPRTSSL